MTWNKNEEHGIFLNRAGEGAGNPVLAGLPFFVDVHVPSVLFSVSGLAGQDSPPTTAISFSEISGSERKFRHRGVAGQAPFASGENRIRVSLVGHDTAFQIERKLHVSAVPSDAIQVWAGDWISIPGAGSPLCAPLCPVRFLSSWFDDFRIKGYGGAERVSIFDTWTNEYGVQENFVGRVVDEKIEDVTRIVLKKHVIRTEEAHHITFRFKSEPGAQANFVDVQATILSKSCYAFEIKDPVTG
jgi:hypothetical protein